jgi:hypothetical protein
MASLVGEQLKDTYDSLLKTSDNDALGGTYKEITDGAGNGSELYLGTGGRVGIGATSPSFNLSVGNNSFGLNFDSGINRLSLRQTNSTSHSVALSSVGNAVVESSTSGSGAGFIQFNTLGSEAMRITSGGDISFRDTSTNEAFYWDASEARLNLFGSDYQFGIQQGVNQPWYHRGVSDGSYRLHLNGTGDVMTLDSSGKVGIGCSPSQVLSIESSSATPTRATITNTGNASAGAGVQFITKSGGSQVSNATVRTDNAGNFSIFTGTTSEAERMRIDSSGNVGIGDSTIANPFSSAYSNILQVGTTSGNTRLAITAGTSKVSDLHFADSNTSAESGTYAGSISYKHTSDDMVFGTATSEAMRIDSSGNVGIGTSPSEKLHIIDSSNPDNTSGSVIIEGRRDGVANVLTLRAKDASAPTLALPNGQGSVLRWQGFDGTDFENMGYILVSADGQAVANGDAPSFMAFGTSADGSSNPTERMRIDSSGSLLLSGLTDSTPNSESAPGYLVTSADGSLFSILSAANNTATRGHIAFSNPNGIVGQITTNASATAYLTSSDYRLKENVVEMTGALDRVDQLKPSRFNFIADADTTVDGFLAHEVADVVPEAISGEKDATEEYEVTPAVLDDEGNVIEEAVMGTRPVYQGIDQSKLVPLLVGAIQELRAEIEQLKAQ